MDFLDIKRLSISTRIGVHEWEQRITRPLYFDISIPLCLSSLQEDDLNLVLDYDFLCKKVRDFVESTSFRLLEILANQVAVFIKAEFQVSEVTVRVSKPHAVENAGDIQISVTR